MAASIRPRADRKSVSVRVEFGAHVGESGLELAQAPRGVRRACLGRIELGPPVDMLAMQPVDVGLQPLAPVFVIAHPLAGESRVRARDP